MEETDENEGMSTGKKVVAGAALGVAVPAAVAVGRKVLGGGGDDDDQDEAELERRRVAAAVA